ncbi:MAG: hypothetical protein ABMB14_39855, partial [Myxococcota bacterium]
DRSAWIRSRWERWASGRVAVSDDEVELPDVSGKAGLGGVRVRLDPAGEGPATVTISAPAPDGIGVAAAKAAGIPIDVRDGRVELVAPLVPSPDPDLALLGVLRAGDPTAIVEALAAHLVDALRAVHPVPPPPDAPPEVHLLYALRIGDTDRLSTQVRTGPHRRAAFGGLVRSPGAAAKALALAPPAEVPELLAAVPDDRRERVTLEWLRLAGRDVEGLVARLAAESDPPIRGAAGEALRRIRT